MKSLVFCLLFAAVTLPVTSAQDPMYPMPELPAPEPMGTSTCAIYLMGIVGDTHYWATSTCPVSNMWGFGQTNGELNAYGCIDGQCLGYANPLLPFNPEKYLEENPVGSVDEAKKACRLRLDYLQKRIDSDEVEELGPRSQKKRLKAWQKIVRKMFDYLDKNGASNDEKLNNYKVFAAADQLHAKSWAYTLIERVSTQPGQHIPDQQQQNSIYDPSVVFTPGVAFPGTIQSTVIVRAVFAGTPAGDKEVFFKLFKFKSNNFAAPMFVGVQITAPGAGTVETCKIVDRHQHGHKIKVTSGAAVNEHFLVSSFEPLDFAP